MTFHSMHSFASDFFYSTFSLGWGRVIHFATDLSLSVNSATGHIFRELRAAIMTPSINPLEKGMQPTPVFLPGESHGQRRAWWATVHGVSKSRTRLSGFHSLALTRIPTGLRGSILYTHLALAPPYSPMNFILSLLVKCKDVFDLSHILFGIIHLEK